MSFKNTLLSCLTVIGLAACGAGTETPGPFVPDANNKALDPDPTIAIYPGPFGTGVGSIIKNYTFMGYPRASTQMGDLAEIHLEDFYNPTGSDVYPPGSPYGAGTQKPKALLLDRAAVWCGPCNMEAKTELPGRHTDMFPNGEFFVMLGETATPGSPAVPSDLQKWATKYFLDYPGAIDPNGFLHQIVGQDAWPGNVIVRTKDMKIVKWVAGVPDEAFWNTFQDVIDGKAVLPGDEIAP